MTPKSARNARSARIRELRARHNMSISDLVKASGLSRPTILALESGRPSNPTIRTLRQLATALSTTMIDLLMDDPT